MSITTTPQAAKVYAIFDNPPSVFTCRVNQSFTTHDKVYQFDYDGASGTVANVKPGMTVLLGTSAGGHDAGITYARKAWTTSRAYCGETSEVDYADNLYVTVLQDFAIWPAYPTLVGETSYMKFDVAYSAQHVNMLPVPILGPDRVAFLSGANVTVAFDGSGSYVYGSTIASHAFTCSGGSISGGSTATPTLTFTATGRYLLTYSVTSTAGVTSTTYRVIHIVTASTMTDVILGTVRGSTSRGDWEFEMRAMATTITARQRTKVILVAEEWYGTTKISYGPVAGAENIVAEGWLENEAVTIDEEKGTVAFSAKGPAFWLGNMYNFVPFGVQDTTGTPASWLQMNGLTVDKALWHLLMWRSTISNCVDVYLSGDTRQATEIEAPSGTLWEQIKAVCQQTILAEPICDNYGRLFVHVPAVLLPAADRAAVPVIATLTHDDWNGISVGVNTVHKTAQVLLSGVNVISGAGTAFFSLAPGHIPEHYGNPLPLERLLLSSQAQANELAGNILERENAPYSFSIKDLLYNNRLVNIAPRQFVALTVLADDNLRGVAYSGNAVITDIELTLDDGAWNINWDAVQETVANLSTNGDIPVRDENTVPGEDAYDEINVPIPSFPPFVTFPTFPPSPPEVLPDPTSCTDDSPETGPYYLAWSLSALDGEDPAKLSAIAYKKCVIRSSTADYQTILRFSINNRGQAYSHLHCYGIDGSGARVATGIVGYHLEEEDIYTITVAFSELTAVAVNGFELALEAGVDTTPLRMYLDQVNSKLYTDVWGYFTSMDAHSEIVDYDESAGYVKFFFSGTNYGQGGTFYGNLNNWKMRVYASSDPGKGYVYAAVEWACVTDPLNRMTIEHGVTTGHPLPWGPKTSAVLESYSTSGSTIQDPFPGAYLNYVIKVNSNDSRNDAIAGFLTVWFSGTYPVRKAGLAMGLLYNVCPAEA